VKKIYGQVIDWFQSSMPQAESELHFDSPFQLLVAVILSAQCTDKRVNMVTPALFERFSTPQSMAAASFDEVYQYVKSVSYPNSKATHLIQMATILCERFGGEVPSTHEELQQLPGVGRKTANVVMSIVYDKPVIAVDTHVFRVARRIGLSNGSTPLAVENDLTANIPSELRPRAHHWLILHGRYTCTARNPKCNSCGLTGCCKEYKKTHR
jgi:endonuclease-3